MKTKILLDMDGVIADFYSGFAGYLNAKLNTGLDLSKEPIEYNLHKWGHNLPIDIVNEEIPRWIISGGYKNMPIYPKAVQFVMQLMDKYDVFIVTARVGDFRLDFDKNMENIIKSDTNQWLKKYGIPTNKLFFEHEKIDFCKQNGINIIIEDKLSTISDAVNEGMQAILMNRGWNEHKQAWHMEKLDIKHPGIHIAYSYLDILNYLNEMSD